MHRIIFVMTAKNVHTMLCYELLVFVNSYLVLDLSVFTLRILICVLMIECNVFMILWFFIVICFMYERKFIQYYVL